MIRLPDQIRGTRVWGSDSVSFCLSSAEGPAFTQAYSALQHRLSLTARAYQLITTMPPGYHREICCLPTEYPNSLTLSGLLQHKLNIKLRAPVMLLGSTCIPSVWPLQRHRLRRPVIIGAIHHSTHCMRRIFRQCPITFPHSTVTDRRRHRAALDNFCLTNINSPSSKFNAKLQLAVHERGITIPILVESSRAVHHRPASSRRLSRRTSAGRTGNA